MGKKYIIELLDDCPSEFKGIIVFGLTPEGQISAEPIPVEDLTPYTEPDLEQVRKEAYQKGYETGYEDGYSEPGKNQQEAYQRGLNDAWDAAKKIGNMPYGEEEKAFGSGGWAFIVKHTASEAIEKIRQYEQEQDRQARIEYNFDEIKDVLETTAKECNVSLDEIAEVLEKMREESNG